MNDTAILAQILALTDAAFLPCRNWARPMPMNTAQARKGYFSGGVPWRSHSGGDAQRKSTERELAAMADAGIIHVHRRQGLRFPLVKLSDPADWDIRLKCGLPSRQGAFLVGMELRRLADAMGWVSEFSLMGNATDKTECMIVENMCLPLAVRDHVESGSTVNGEARYRLTESGVQWLANCKKPKPDSGKSDPAACQIYDETIVSALHTLETEKISDSRELGLLPLSAGDSPQHCSQPRNCSVKKNRA